jgi:putative hydrolase of HD superfamily
LRFTAEIDRMSSVLRRTLLIDRSRRENDAEHSWHIAVMAMLFEEYAVRKVNIMHAVEMMLVHDLVEIYAGDTFAYDIDGYASKAAREKDAADKLFSILPEEQGMHIRALWEEFDAAESNDAKYANCLDRLQPFFHNMLTEGHTWRNSDFPTNSILVRKRMAIVGEFMPEIHSWIAKNLDFAIENQWLKEK